MQLVREVENHLIGSRKYAECSMEKTRLENQSRCKRCEDEVNNSEERRKSGMEAEF